MKKMSRLRKKISIAFFFLFAALALTSTLQTVATDDNGINEKKYSNFEKLLQIASSEGKVKVIVKLNVPKIKELTDESTRFCSVEPGMKSPWGGTNADTALHDAITWAAYNVSDRLNGTGFQVNRFYTSIPYMALEVSAEALTSLQDIPEVLDIEEDKPVKLIYPVKDDNGGQKTQDSIPGTTAADNLSRPMLDNTVSVIGADTAWGMGYTGSGWYVAVLDSGIRGTHEFFNGKTIVEACFARGYDGTGDCPNGGTTMTGSGSAAHYPSSYSGYDHGTHVAGIAAGNNGSLFGVAKNADIIAVQVFSMIPAGVGICDGSTSCISAYTSDVLAGLDYIYSIRGSYSIAAVNLSLGGGAYDSPCDGDSRKAAIDNLRAAGIATVIATGNNGYCGYISAPACISTAAAVGASNDLDQESNFNNWHSTLQTFFAPGYQVYSSTGASNSSYDSWDGTSMATPHVAGAWVLLKQAKPNGTVSELLAILQSTGVSIGSVCDYYATSIPRIQVDAAISAIPSAITVTSPNGGENWQSGSTRDITWDAQGVPGLLKITLWKDGALVGVIANNVASSPGVFPWTVGLHSSGTAVPGTGYTIKIKEKGTTVSDISSSFSICSLEVTSPNGGECWQSGSSRDITWDAQEVPGLLKITLWKDGALVGVIANNVASSPGVFPWTVGLHSSGTAAAGTGYTIKIKEKGTTVSDISSSFSICSLEVTSPNGGESWPIGSTRDITWNAQEVPGLLKITLWKDGALVGAIANNVASSPGVFPWTVGLHSSGTAAAGTGYTIKIKEKGTTVSDISSSFSICSLEVTSPNGGESWPIGSTRDITWDAREISGLLKITLWSGGTLVGRIANNVDASSGKFQWIVGQHSGRTAPAGTVYTIKIKEKDTAVSDSSDGFFELY